MKCATDKWDDIFVWAADVKRWSSVGRNYIHQILGVKEKFNLVTRFITKDAFLFSPPPSKKFACIQQRSCSASIISVYRSFKRVLSKVPWKKSRYICRPESLLSNCSFFEFHVDHQRETFRESCAFVCPELSIIQQRRYYIFSKLHYCITQKFQNWILERSEVSICGFYSCRPIHIIFMSPQSGNIVHHAVYILGSYIQGLSWSVELVFLD